uniref:S-acyltransferase n=1 Tax=Kalanchoe fedtschenkoi TaxID=63787 RepID=A0A7N0TB65_KALFE
MNLMDQKSDQSGSCNEITSFSHSNMTAQAQIHPPNNLETQNKVKLMNCMSEKLEPLNKFVTQKLSQLGFRDSSKRTRLYHVWPGKNVFFFHGRLICGSDPKGLILTSTTIILSSWIFSVYSAFDDSNLITIFCLILTLLVGFLNNLLNYTYKFSAVDPGIIPRTPGEFVVRRSDSSRGARKSRTVTVNGVQLRTRYCKICNIFRPPRSCHCAVCDNCVQKFDHHCPWLSQCIGLRNYRFYLTFLFSTWIYFAYIWSFSCWRIHKRIQKSGIGFVGIINKCPETLALATLSFAAVGFLLGQIVSHLYLAAINQASFQLSNST